MKSNLYEKKAQIFKALSNPVRLEIMDFLADGEKCVCEIVENLNYEQPHISKSLIKLKEAACQGLIAGINAVRKIQGKDRSCH